MQSKNKGESMLVRRASQSRSEQYGAADVHLLEDEDRQDRGRRRKKWVKLLVPTALFLFFTGCGIAGVSLTQLTSQAVVNLTAAIPSTKDLYPKKYMLTVENGEVDIRFGYVFTFGIDNPSPMKLFLYIKAYQILYYPVGRDPTCLHYHGNLMGNDQSKKLYISPMSEELGADTLNISSSILLDGASLMDVLTAHKPNPEADVEDYGGPKLEIPIRLGAKISSTAKTDLRPYRLLAYDCNEYKGILLSIKFIDHKSYSSKYDRSLFRDYEHIFWVECRIQPEAHDLFNDVTFDMDAMFSGTPLLQLISD